MHKASRRSNGEQASTITEPKTKRIAQGASAAVNDGPFVGALPDDCDVSTLNAIQIKERETVLAMLDEHRWNVSNVAKTLGISRNTLYRKMRRLHIRLSHDAAQASVDDACGK